jgi:TRAP-type C4-dicarboxylate transport system permease small subunit
MGLQVLMRYAFNNSLTWSEEVTRMLFVWVVFLGAAAILKRGSHMGLDMFGWLPQRWRLGIDMVNELVALAFASTLVWYGIEYARLGADQNTAATGVSLAWVYAALPVGGALYGLRTLVRIARLTRGQATPKSGAFGE